MSNHNPQILSKEVKERYNSKAFAQELLRARVDDYSPDNSLPWEGREEDYYPNPDNEYTEEEVQAHIDRDRLQTKTYILRYYRDEDLQTHINTCLHEAKEREEVKKTQEEGKAHKPEHQTPKWKSYIADEECYKQIRKKQQLREQLRKKQKLDHSDTNKNSTK